MSSSSSPAKSFSQIAHKFKRPRAEAWRASEEVKQAIIAKEKEIENHSENIRSANAMISHMEYKIQEKRKWATEANEEIRATEQWIRATEISLSKQAREMSLEVKEMNAKVDWVDAKKKNFPYDFPEWQIVDDE